MSKTLQHAGPEYTPDLESDSIYLAARPGLQKKSELTTHAVCPTVSHATCFESACFSVLPTVRRPYPCRSLSATCRPEQEFTALAAHARLTANPASVGTGGTGQLSEVLVLMSSARLEEFQAGPRARPVVRPDFKLWTWISMDIRNGRRPRIWVMT